MNDLAQREAQHAEDKRVLQVQADEISELKAQLAGLGRRQG